MNEQSQLVMIVEDDEDMAQLNSRILKRHGYDTLIANTAAEARKLIKTNSPDLFVFDISLPGEDAYSLCSEFRLSTDAPVLFLSGKTETEEKIKGFESGGDYYLMKPYDRDELIAIIKSLLRRSEQAKIKTDKDKKIISKGSLTLNLAVRKAYVKERDAGLSPKEYSVLLLLVQNEDKELTYEQLYEYVWGSAMCNDSCALRQQISRLKKKLDIENVADFAIFNEHGKGYVFTTM